MRLRLPRSKGLRALLWSAIGLALATGLIGFAHTPYGRPLLGTLSGVPGCPVLEAAEPEAVERQRIHWAERRAGMLSSPALLVLGFELGRTQRESVRAALDSRGARCKPARKDSALECTNVVDEHGLRSDDAFLQFDPEGRLVAVDVFREPATSSEALRELARVEAGLQKNLGAPTSRRGARDAAYLSGRAFRQVSLEYRFADFIGRVSATNLGARGLRVREQYQWIPERTGGGTG